MLRLAVLLTLLVAAVPGASANTARWETASDMPVPATGHLATLLTDGRVLVTGGEPEVYAWPVPVAQVYDPGTGRWSLAHPMSVGRIADTATLLHDGRVLVVGGIGPKLKRLTSAEVYDPVRNVWVRTPPLPQSRFSQSASLLPDGQVLIAGGIVGSRISRTTLLYDPAHNRWSPGPSMRGLHAQQSGVTLPDGRILIAGGYGGPPEMFNPVTMTWSVVGKTRLREHPIMTNLPNGTVLLAAGLASDDRDLKTARLFEPAKGTWTSTGSLHTPRNSAAGAVLPDGTVLVAGGEQVTQHVLRSSEIYDPAIGHWSATAPLATPRDAATATLLRGGTVLVCGGTNFDGVLASCEQYFP